MSQQINLFEPKFKRQTVLCSAVHLVQILGLVSLLSLSYYAYARYQLTQLLQQSNDTSQRNTAEQEKLARLIAENPSQQSPVQLQEERKSLQAHVQAQQALIDSLQTGEMGNTNGYSEYLRAFSRQAVPGVWLTGFEVVGDGVQMTLRGGALKPELVPNYMRKLSQEKSMHGKNFSALQMQQSKTETGNTESRHVEFVLQSVPDGESK